jgi:hypothetical protein
MDGTALSWWQAQRATLWLFVASGWLVAIEPSPYEFLFLAAAMVFLPVGLRFHPTALPFAAALVLYNVGGIASLVPVAEDSDALLFVAISLFMGATALFFSGLIAGDPTRFAVIRNAYIWAAVMASICGLIGYFDVGGLRGSWAPLYRAQGLFKDPNVFSAFLVAALCFLTQGFLLGEQRHRLWSAMALCIIGAGLFFAFSRGAWINAAVALTLLAAINFLLHPSGKTRTRIVLLVCGICIAATTLILFALSFESTRTLFAERANLINYYDGGETGRFGNQLNSLPLLLQLPNGMGPLQFRTVFGNDPHNVFINVFASNGWLGGLSFLLLIAMTIWIGWKTILRRSLFQQQAIAVFCPMVAIILQSIQIDTEHWRHLFLLIGVMWGLHGATTEARQ